MQYRKFNLEKYRRQMKSIIGDGPETRVFWDALNFASEAHEDQWRRSGDSYIMHPCSVARILAEELDVHNPEILAAALLHDTVEDVEFVTSDVIRTKFGANVEAIVEGCTKVTHYTGDKQTFSKLVHRKIFSGAAAKPEVMIVKLADRLHNLRTLSSMPRHKRQKIADETLDIYAPLATILGLFAIKRELYTLALAYKFPKQGNKLQLHINRLRENPEMLKIVEQVQQAMVEEGITAEVSLRTKGLWGYYDVKNRILVKKLERPQEILIKVDSRSNCYRALGVVNLIYPPIPRTIRDFIANPKPTGYQGLHARANIEGRKNLFKIRTEEMAHRAERGLVRDWTSAAKSQGRYMRGIQEMFDILGSDDTVSYREMIAAGGRKEIYTYTPQGDLICLPVNSIVLDFAFRVHTAIGHSCVGAMIGNRRINLTERLKDGDVVKILRQDTPVRFDPNIQKLCQTPRARSELTKAFRKRRKALSGETGRSVLQQEMRRYGLSFDLILKQGMKDILTYFDIESLERLFQKVGQGQVRLRELIYEIRNGLYAGKETLQPPTGVFNRIELITVDPVVVKSSACCKPTPLDKGLIGLLSERGISLHRKDCSRLQKLNFQREDAIEVRWKNRDTRVAKPQKIIIMAASRHRLFMLLSVAPEEMKVTDVQRLSGKPTPTPAWEIDFSVANLYGLKKIIKHLDRSSLVYEFDFEQ
ncbi:MAG: HD domain-containing protein [Thermodesulfobacteriota bacterium]|nr:HD domain-containing protein [Thermodesulfobacteriota bacterium]